MKMKKLLFLGSILVFCGATFNVYARKPMQVTVINDGPEPVTKVILMRGEVRPESYSVSREFRLTEPIGTNSRGAFSFDAAVITPSVFPGGQKIYMQMYAVEIRWGGGCKKIVDLNYELQSQAVYAGAKRCGLHPFEVRKMSDALREADYAYTQKDHESASRNYSIILEIDPKNEHALHRRGHSYTALQKFALAITDFSGALAVTKDPAHLHSDRGLLYAEQNDWPRAVVDFSRAHALSPQNKTYLTYRWLSVCKIGNKEAALADEKKLVDMGAQIKKTCEQQSAQ